MRMLKGRSLVSAKIVIFERVWLVAARLHLHSGMCWGVNKLCLLIFSIGFPKITLLNGRDSCF